jgi:thiazole/oxazole-forming peptide maturase SagC family component
MPIVKSQRLRIPNHYYVYCDPPDKNGDEVLHFVSSQRRLKLKGHAFREFVQHVVPMLNGEHSFEEIHSEVSDLFEADDLAACFNFLNEQGLLEDSESWGLSDAEQVRLRPQLNLFHELSEHPWELQQRIAKSRIAVFGLTPSGIAAARALGAAGVGSLRCVDTETVSAAHAYFSPEMASSEIGTLRTEALRPHIPCAYEGAAEKITDDSQMESAIAGCDFVISAIDEGNLSLIYRLNRVAQRTRTPWLNVAAAGFEALVGPTIYPGETACYMCYRMRVLSCSENPESGYDFESYLNRRKKDDSAHRANLVTGTAIAGQIAATEALKAVSRMSPLATRGRLLVFDLRDLSSTFHVVLRKPWCPACASGEGR